MELLGISFLILLFLVPFIRQHLRDQKNEERYKNEDLKRISVSSPPSLPIKEAPSKPAASVQEAPQKKSSSLLHLKQGLIFSMILKNPYHEEN